MTIGLSRISFPCCAASASSPTPATRRRLSLCPARDVLPFQNLSPHPELQEERATGLWKIATRQGLDRDHTRRGHSHLQRSAEYYSDLARILRRGESFDVDNLLAHLNTVGYTAADVVEMPGEYALRGPASSMLFAGSPSVRRASSSSATTGGSRSAAFDPASQRSVEPHGRSVAIAAHRNSGQRSSSGRDHTRLSGANELAGTEEISRSRRALWRSHRFSWLGVLRPLAGSRSHSLRLTSERSVLLDEPDLLRSEFDRLLDPGRRSSRAQRRRQFWSRSVDLYFRLTIGGRKSHPLPERTSSISASRAAKTQTHGHLPDAAESSLPTARSYDARRSAEAHWGRGTRCLFSVPNTGEVERPGRHSSPNTTFRFA